MITEIITFSIPDGMTREEVVANYRRSAPSWRANPDLIRKNYLYDAESRRASGVYLWRTLEAARRARDAAWVEKSPPHLFQRTGRAVLRNAARGRQCPRQDDRRG